MKPDRANRLRKAGWTIGSTKEFLGLSDQEAAIIEIRLALADNVRKRRLAEALSQTDLARRIGSSQSRVAKMESGDATVSLDLLVRTLLALGTTRRELGSILAGRKLPAA
jgi:ribosome-binding protein aMBF1 (putative translation factor)